MPASRGVSVDLARELGKRLGVPVELLVVDAAGKAVEAIKSAQADNTFVAIDPVRGADILQTSPYVIIEGAYLLRIDSPIKTNADVDRPGNRIAVGKSSAYVLYLSREVKAATLQRAPTSPALFFSSRAGGGRRRQAAAATRCQAPTRLAAAGRPLYDHSTSHGSAQGPGGQLQVCDSIC